MTKETIKKETTEIIKRIEALESVIDNDLQVPVFASDEVLREMLKEYKDRYEYLIGSKEFMVHFEGGGWNTCYGITQEDAFDNACLEFNKEATPDGHVAMKVRSVSLATSEGIDSAMRLFY